MRIFVSYARRDRAVVDSLLQDIRRARHEVWVDEELTGGQAWWDTILGTIRGADLFVVALSPDWLNSRACAAELQYAVSCHRAVLPIMVARVSPQMAPPVVANAQILDYLERTADAAINLVTALSVTPAARPLPQPLPSAPAVPMSYMNTYRERLDERNLSLQAQSQLLSELRAHLSEDDDRESATALIRRLRHRGDITESVGKEIDALLASVPTPASQDAETPGSSSTGSTERRTPAGWYADPYRRFEQRYWDGATWTESVATQGRQAVDPLVAVSQTATSDFATSSLATTRTTSSNATLAGRWDSGTYITLILVSLCFGIVGVIVGAINLKKPARKSQAQVLLVVGIISMICGVILAVKANSNTNSGF